MKNIRLILSSLICSFVFFSGVGALAWADDEMAKPMKLTLDVAKAVAENKDVSEGLKAVAKDELSNWMWDSIGGYEKIVFQNSEAELPGVREKAKKIYEAIMSIDKAATAIAEGKYDDALMASVDTIVGAVDHPAASALWAAVKMTYESHRLVQNTQAELEIETLYGMMSNDRRMMGVVDPKSDQPPTIPENAQMSDYFYEKYVMTNDHSRQMLKSYVTKVLGDEWPEQSWGDYLKGWMALGSGVDTARSAEIEAMDTEWRQKARTWISQLIKDVNKQAKVAWGEVRVRQQLAEFKRFSDRAAKFYNGDFEQMLKEFNAIKQYQKEEGACAKILADSPSAYASIEKQVNEMKPADVKKLGGWNAQVEEWQLKLLSASSKMQIIRKESLAQSLSAERQKWLKLAERLSQITAQKNDSADEIVDQIPDEGMKYSGMGYNPYQQAFFTEAGGLRETYYNSIFLPKLEAFDFDSVSGDVEVADFDGKKKSLSLTGDADRVMSALMEQLNSGDFEGAGKVIAFWNEIVAKAMYEHFAKIKDEFTKIPAKPDDLLAAEKALEQAMQQYDAAVKPLYAQIEALARQAEQYNWYDPRRKSFDDQIGRLYQQIYDLGRGLSPYYRAVEVRRYAWGGYFGDSVRGMGAEGLARLETIAGAVLGDKAAEMQEAYQAYDNLRRTLKTAMEEYKAKFTAILKELPDEYMHTHYEEWMQKTRDEISANTYTFFVAAKERGDQVYVHSMPWIFKGMAQQILDGVIDEQRPLSAVDAFESKVRIWEKVIAEWSQMPEVPADDINQIRVLVDRDFDLETMKKEIKARVQYAQDLKGSFPNVMREAAQRTQTDRENRQKDADKLEAVGTRLQKFFNELRQKGLVQITRDIEVVLPPAGDDGMIIAEKPFKHYMVKEELAQITEPILAAWNQQPDAGFAATYAPGYVEKFKDILSLPGVPAAREENFINPSSNQVLYKSDLEQALKILQGMSVPDPNFEKNMAEVARLIPGLMRVMTSKEMKYHEQQAKLFGMSSVEEYFKKTRRGTPAPDYRLKENVLAELKDPGFQNDLGKTYIEIAELTQKLVDENREYGIKQEQARVAAENERAMEEYRKKQDAENAEKNAERVKQTNPLLYYGYQLINPRVNSYSVEKMSGQIIVTQDKLVGGQIELTARLNHINHAKTMLISEDGGRTWKEIPLSQDVRYVFAPIPNKPYQPFLKIKTDDMIDVTMGFLEGGQIVYQDADFLQEVVKATTALAEAYERADIGGFSRLISRDFLGNKSALEEGVRFDFDMFLDIHLTIYVNRIDQRGDMFVAETKWDKTQTPRKTGQQQKTSGRTTMMFVMEDGQIKIKNLRGDLIYATLSPEIAESSGKSAAVVDQIRTAQESRNPEQPGAGTTEDAGGVTTSTSSSSTLTSKNATLVRVDATSDESIDFSTDTVSAGAGAGDATFTFPKEFSRNGAAVFELSGTDYDSLTAASGTIDETLLFPDNGETYLFITTEGYYGKFKVISVAEAPVGTYTMQIKYAVQTDGSTNLTTP